LSLRSRLGLGYFGLLLLLGLGFFSSLFLRLLLLLFLLGVVCQMLGQEVTFDQVIPERVGSCLVFRPGEFVPLDLDLPVGIKRELWVVEYLPGVGHAFFHAGLIDVVDVYRGTDIAGYEKGIERGAIFGAEAVHILLGEVDMAEIEESQVGFEDLL